MAGEGRAAEEAESWVLSPSSIKTLLILPMLYIRTQQKILKDFLLILS